MRITRPFDVALWTSLFTVLCSQVLVFGQCSAPEVVKGAEKYNVLVCQGASAAQSGDDRKALGYFLSASQQTLLEFPNIHLFARIAKTYARLSQFREADLYLSYDNISILWQLGIIRCQAQTAIDNEVLFQDGRLLQSNQATYMASRLCGPIYDNNAYFGDRDADSLIPTAKAILRHGALRKEIEGMRTRRGPK
jgi:hypothetical protein